jgi:hypothetical protein
MTKKEAIQVVAKTQHLVDAVRGEISRLTSPFDKINAYLDKQEEDSELNDLSGELDATAFETTLCEFEEVLEKIGSILEDEDEDEDEDEG